MVRDVRGSSRWSDAPTPDVWPRSVSDASQTQSRTHVARFRRQRLKRRQVRSKAARIAVPASRSESACGEHPRKADHVCADGAVRFMLEDDRIVAGHVGPQCFGSLIPASLRITSTQKARAATNAWGWPSILVDEEGDEIPGQRRTCASGSISASGRGAASFTFAAADRLPFAALDRLDRSLAPASIFMAFRRRQRSMTCASQAHIGVS